MKLPAGLQAVLDSAQQSLNDARTQGLEPSVAKAHRADAQTFYTALAIAVDPNLGAVELEREVAALRASAAKAQGALGAAWERQAAQYVQVAEAVRGTNLVDRQECLTQVREAIAGFDQDTKKPTPPPAPAVASRPAPPAPAPQLTPAPAAATPPVPTLRSILAAHAPTPAVEAPIFDGRPRQPARASNVTFGSALPSRQTVQIKMSSEDRKDFVSGLNGEAQMLMQNGFSSDSAEVRELRASAQSVQNGLPTAQTLEPAYHTAIAEVSVGQRVHRELVRITPTDAHASRAASGRAGALIHAKREAGFWAEQMQTSTEALKHEGNPTVRRVTNLNKDRQETELKVQQARIKRMECMEAARQVKARGDTTLAAAFVASARQLSFAAQPARTALRELAARESASSTSLSQTDWKTALSDAERTQPQQPAASTPTPAPRLNTIAPQVGTQPSGSAPSAPTATVKPEPKPTAVAARA